MDSLQQALAGLSVFERGWLSSNNILIHAADGEPGATLVDTSHVNHAGQTVALVRHALAGRPLAAVVNTHLHSDHCGGNAAVEDAFGLRARVPAALADAVRDWDAQRLGHEPTGQICARFVAGGTLSPGDAFVAGGRRWEVIASSGHDSDSLVFFDARHGLLLSADALWQHGLGVVFPELVGEPGFDDVEATLAMIERLPVQAVVPGHGSPFSDVAGALAQSRKRLQAFRAEPARHARHCIKVFLKYHLMEVRRQPAAEVIAWAESTGNVGLQWRRFGHREAASPREWVEALLGELVGSGALALDDGVVADR